MATTAGLSPWMRRAVPALIAEMRRRGYGCTLYSGRRSYRQQLALYLKGHTTVAPWEGSKHQDGQAVDLVIAPKSGYAVAGKLWTEMGGTWGGNFKDPALAAVEFQHFEQGSSRGRLVSSSSSSSRTGARSVRRSGAGARNSRTSLRSLQLRARR